MPALRPVFLRRPSAPRPAPLLLALAASFAVFAAPAARSADEAPALAATLTDPALGTREVRLAAVAADGGLGLAGGGALKADEYLRLDFPAPAAKPGAAAPPAAPPSAPFVTLADGQRVRCAGGLPSGTRDNRLLLPCGRFGELAVDTDTLVSWSVRGEALPPAKGKDVVTLLDGQVLTGTVLGFAGQGKNTVLRLRRENKEWPLSFSTLASVQLAASPRPPGFKGLRVGLADGSWLAVDGAAWRPEDGRWHLTGALGDPQREVVLAPADVGRLELGRPGRALVGAGTLAFTPEDGVCRILGLEHPPRRSGEALDFHAPQTLRLELPPGARLAHLRLELRLPPDASPAERALADCRVKLRRRDQPEQEVQLNADHPGQSLRLTLDERELALWLVAEPGAHGPVLDRLRLTGELLVENPAP